MAEFNSDRAGVDRPTTIGDNLNGYSIFDRAELPAPEKSRGSLRKWGNEDDYMILPIHNGKDVRYTLNLPPSWQRFRSAIAVNAGFITGAEDFPIEAYVNIAVTQFPIDPDTFEISVGDDFELSVYSYTEGYVFDGSGAKPANLILPNMELPLTVDQKLIDMNAQIDVVPDTILQLAVSSDIENFTSPTGISSAIYAVLYRIPPEVTEG